jgi:hypothetical protein
MTSIMFSRPILIYTDAMFMIAIVLSALIFAAIPSPAADAPMFPACNECHSKNPKMVRMHSALGFKGCFACHGPSAKPADRSKRSDDQRCLPCHRP